MIDWYIALFVLGAFVFLGVMYWRRRRHTYTIDPHSGQALLPGPIPRPERWLVRAYLTCYSIYALLLPITVIAGLVWMTAVRAILPLTPIDRDWHDLTLLLIMFMIWIGLILLVGCGEIYMRHGIEKRIGLQRVLIIGSTLVTFVAVGLLLIWLSSAEIR